MLSRQFEQLQLFDPGPENPAEPLSSNRNPQKSPTKYFYNTKKGLYGAMETQARDETGRVAGFLSIHHPKDSYLDVRAGFVGTDNPDRPKNLSDGEYGEYDPAHPAINVAPPIYGKSAEIGLIDVDYPHRDQGIAHNLLREARAALPDWDIRHSSTLSTMGLAFDKSHPEARMPKKRNAIHYRTHFQSSLFDDWQNWRPAEGP